MFDDIISGLASRLGTTDATVEILLSVCILVAVGLAMTAAHVNIVGTSIVLIAIIGLLTVMGWFPIWISAVIIIIAGVMLAKMVGDWYSGGGE